MKSVELCQLEFAKDLALTFAVGDYFGRTMTGAGRSLLIDNTVFRVTTGKKGQLLFF